MNPFSMFFKPSTPALEKKVELAYTAASTGRRVQSWLSKSTDANTELSVAIGKVRDRARDLVRNNPYARHTLDILSANLIGTGILPYSQNTDYLGLLSKYLDSKLCDFNEELNFYGLQKLAVESLIESGEIIIVKHYDKTKTFPLQFKILESDYIDTDKNDKTKINGIEYQNGKLVGYWLFDSHPGSGNSSKSSFVKAEDVIHLFRKDRPQQNRGISWLSNIAVYLKLLNDYQDAVLEKIKISNLFTAFVLDQNAEAPYTSSDLSLEPGSISIIPPGKTIEFSDPPDAPDNNNYILQLLRMISSGVNIPYELFTNDYSQSNYSSSRMTMVHFLKYIESLQYNLIIPVLLDRIAQWFFESYPFINEKKPSLKEQPIISWIPPRKTLLDPSKEIPPIIDQIRAGLLPLSYAIQENGYFAEEILKAYQNDNEIIDKYKLVFESDPRKDAERKINSTTN